MIRITISYPRIEGATFDHDYYQADHRALLQQRFSAHGLHGIEIDRCLTDGAGGPPHIVAVTHMLFQSAEGFAAGMQVHAREIMADVARYTTIQPVVIISETLR